MLLPEYTEPQLPDAPNAIQKGVPLKRIINTTTASYLAKNIQLVDKSFDVEGFLKAVNIDEQMSLMDRGRHLANILFTTFKRPYAESIAVLVESFTPIHQATEELGLRGFFYLPHSFFISQYGLDVKFNDGRDSFKISMQAQYEMTQRFTAEFCIREFLIHRQEETLAVLNKWSNDKSAHVRRLCSEGSRPKLPWGKHIKAFIEDPSPVIPILETLKDDPSLYVRRSVANHLGDIAKNHLDLVLSICENWLTNAPTERKWLIRHALRYPDKKGNAQAHALRIKAK